MLLLGTQAKSYPVEFFPSPGHRASRLFSWCLEPYPRQVLRLRTRHAAVCHHDRYPLSPGLPEVLRYHEPLCASHFRCRPSVETQHPRSPGSIYILTPPAAPPLAPARAPAVARRHRRPAAPGANGGTSAPAGALAATRGGWADARPGGLCCRAHRAHSPSGAATRWSRTAEDCLARTAVL
jgi:hypothetical protein